MADPNEKLSTPLSAEETTSLEALHDIKPVPEFSPFPWTFLWATIGLIALALLFAVLRRRYLRAKPSPQSPTVSPIELALQELSLLESLRGSSNISLREYCARASLLLRTYLESRLGFSAVEQTTAEIAAQFPSVIAQALPVLSKERQLTFSQRTRALLKNTEQLTFGSNSSEAFHLQGPELASVPVELQSLLTDLESALTKEAERTRSVMEQRT